MLRTRLFLLVTVGLVPTLVTVIPHKPVLAQSKECQGKPQYPTDCQDPTKYNSGHCLDNVKDIAIANLTGAGGSVGGQMILRYSNTCKTNWVKIISRVGKVDFEAIMVRETSPTQPVVDNVIKNSDSMYSDMLYAPTQPVRAWGVILNPDGTQKYCGVIDQAGSGASCYP